ncbi:TonB-dependent receptor [Pseudoduganella sp.]|uniref:TonB-dependent receptor n=1 Tax=Pseudoduganella sp. TaxID=1880898 RepID=UPI0035AF80B9
MRPVMIFGCAALNVVPPPRPIHLRFAILAALAAMAQPASAQSAPSVSGDKTAEGNEPVETVIITAQRRREPAREVPLTADVVRGDALERGGYQSLGDLSALLPGLNYNQAGSGSGQSQITMRGITTGAQVGATVSMYIDDVPFGSSSAYAGGGSNALDLGLFDLRAVEVLRGPQGTLYGAGAMGGLIKYAAIEPELGTASAQVTTELSSTRGGGPGHVVRGVVNAPLGEHAALRATAYRRANRGFIRDLGHSNRLADGSDINGGRIALHFAPSADWSLRLAAFTQHQQRDGSSSEDVDLATGQPAVRGRAKRLFVEEPNEVRNDLVSLSLNAKFSWGTFDAITGWQRSRNEGRADPSALYSAYLAPLGITAAGFALDYSFYNRKLTQEIRFTSSRSRVFEWLAGAFFTDEAGSKSQILNPLNAERQPIAPLLANATFPSTFRETALFATGTYYLNEQADATLGVRRGHNSQRLNQTFNGLFAPPPLPGASSSEDVTTWLLTGRWRPAAHQALYARAASGYRPGGPLPVIVNPVTGQPLNKPFFRSDSLWSYELGWKGDLVPGQATTELALFRIDWKDMQAFTSNAGFSGIGNAGRARSRGLEWTVRARPGAGWRLAGALSVIHSTLQDDSADLGGKAGDRLPDTAKLSTALQADRDFLLDERPAYVGLTLRHTGDRVNAFAAQPGVLQYRMPSYATLDLRAGIEFAHASLGFFVRNLTNARAQTSADTAFSLAGAPARVNLAPSRTVGIQLSATY